jgi:hypothetical protein
MAKENAEVKQKEIKDWEEKVVVKNKHFFVNTKELKSNQGDKYRGMLEGPATKVGLKLSKSRVTQMAERQIKITKSLADLPVSSLMKEPYI